MGEGTWTLCRFKSEFGENEGSGVCVCVCVCVFFGGGGVDTKMHTIFLAFIKNSI